MKIMVTGAAGGYGSYAVEYVRKFAPDAVVYGLVREADKGMKLEKKGIQVRIGDYADLDSMVKAFEGIDRILFVSVPVYDLQKNVVKAAKIAGVNFIAYTGIADPQYPKFGLEINHRQTEQLIKESGIPHTFLRNNWYLELIADYVKAAGETGKFPYFAGQGKIAFALKREYAEAGARVITSEEHPEILTFAGNPVTFADVAKASEEASGKSLNVYEVTKGGFAQAWRSGEISDLGMMLATSYQDYTLAGNNGEEALTADDFEKVLGHPLTPLASALKELL